MQEAPKFISNDLLRAIREQTNWRQLFTALGLERTQGGNEDDWWARSPFSEDRHPSFHLGEKGWYCWSTGQGGGVIELVQKVMGSRLGREMNCYEAGRWLVENGLSRVGAPEMTRIIAETEERSAAAVAADRTDPETGAEAKADPTNRPIRQTLVPLLEMEHQEFTRRGIARETCEALGCGYLPEDASKSPLRGWIVFQVRCVQEDEEAGLKPVILTHIGRAVSAEEEEHWGKWRAYEGFQTSLELYHIDRLLLDKEALRQAQATGRVLVVEGCFDVAKLFEAEIRNVVATFGSRLHEGQLPRLDLIVEKTGVQRFRFFYDRDRAGREGMEKARERIGAERAGRYEAEVFDWEVAFPSPARGTVPIPEEIGDACEFSVTQLKWLRGKGFL